MAEQQQVKVLDLEGKQVEAVDLPKVFRIPVRPDVINKAYVALDSHRRRPQGRDPLAGERTTAETNNPPTGRGISRIPRVKGERYSKSGMAGGVASIVHGRLPHPPRAEKVIRKEINVKEKRLALASAIAATGHSELVTRRGHRYSGELPVVVSNDIEKVSSARQLRGILSALGMSEELERIKRGSRRSNSSSLSRNRRARGVGPLLVVADSSNIGNIAKSFGGVSIARSQDLSVLDLAPGSSPGRLTVWSKSALQSLTKQVQEIGERYAA